MLNELLIVERGARQAGVEMAQRHPDIKDARSMPTLLIRLDDQGHIAAIRPVHRDVTPWTLRDGQHNSFPFVQPKRPFLDIPADDERRQSASDRKSPDRRNALLSLVGSVPLNVAALDGWSSAAFLKRLSERRAHVDSLVGTEAAALPAAIDRFVLAISFSQERPPVELSSELVRSLHDALRTTADDHWLDIAAALLVGRLDPKTRECRCEGALLFDAEGAWRSLEESRLIAPVSEAIRAAEMTSYGSSTGCCGLSGQDVPLVESKFPQPNLPVLGQTFLFARNSDTPAGYRYGRSAADTMPVGQETAIRLAAAAEALTNEDRQGKTWRSLPGEVPKQSDLFLAFVEAAPDAPVAAALAEEDAEVDYSAEVSSTASDQADAIAAFEKRTERLIEAVQGKVSADFDKIQILRLAVLRKVDPANRKIVYAGEVPVKDYHRAATNWAAGERNVPPWLSLPVLHKGERKPRLISHLHVAPLGVIAFSKQMFIRGGTERQETVGLPASEAMELFLDIDRPRVRRFLRLVLARRTALISGTAHALRRGIDAAKVFDRREVLRTVTLLGVLLHKLGRTIDSTEGYMNATAFKLGQLLAASDIVHAGYCADVRGGDLPPSLLGNQVFAMAQAAPVKALALLSRRWPPYEGWARKTAREMGRVESLPEQRLWDVRKALRHVREMRPLASEIAPALETIRVDDVFRAELLLGYLAGLPKSQKDDGSSEEASSSD